MSESELVPNFTFFIMLGLFFASYFMLSIFVFRPYLNLLEARRAKTSGLKERAIQERERADKLREDYETFMKAERKKVASWMDEERKKVAEEERGVIQKARNQVNDELKTLRDSIHVETERVRGELLPMVNEYSSQLASKVLGHKVKVSVTTAGHSNSSTAETSVPG